MPKRATSDRKRFPAAGRLLLPLTLAVALGTSSCRTHSDTWSFSVTREVYGHDGRGVEFDGHFHCGDGGEAAALVLLAIILLPVAIDVVLLPVTLTHDLCD